MKSKIEGTDLVFENGAKLALNIDPGTVISAVQLALNLYDSIWGDNAEPSEVAERLERIEGKVDYIITIVQELHDSLRSAVAAEFREWAIAEVSAALNEYARYLIEGNENEELLRAIRGQISVARTKAKQYGYSALHCAAVATDFDDKIAETLQIERARRADLLALELPWFKSAFDASAPGSFANARLALKSESAVRLARVRERATPGRVLHQYDARGTRYKYVLTFSSLERGDFGYKIETEQLPPPPPRRRRDDPRLGLSTFLATAFNPADGEVSNIKNFHREWAESTARLRTLESVIRETRRWTDHLESNIASLSAANEAAQ